MKNTLKLLIGLIVVTALAFGQASWTTTTLSSAVTSYTGSPVYVASATGISNPAQPLSGGGIGTPAGAAFTYLYVDRELMRVMRVSGTTVYVERGAEGTGSSPHASGATVYVGPGNYFALRAPSGNCTAANLTVLPLLEVGRGRWWNCPTSGFGSGVWITSGYVENEALTDGYFFINPNSCIFTAVSGTTIAAGNALRRSAANNDVLYVTTNTVGGVVALTCDINVPTRLTVGKGVSITAIDLLYGAQTIPIASIGAASVKTVTYPLSTAAGVAAAGTVGTALGGTVTVTPTTLQLTDTTTGQCFNQKLSFGTPIDVNTTNTKLGFEQQFTLTGTSATTLEVCGLIAFYTASPL